MKTYFKAGVLMLGLFLGGCAGAQVKKAQQDIFKDLNQIVQYQDCEVVCEQLKAYLVKAAAAQ